MGRGKEALLYYTLLCLNKTTWFSLAPSKGKIWHEELEVTQKSFRHLFEVSTHPSCWVAWKYTGMFIGKWFSFRSHKYLRLSAAKFCELGKFQVDKNALRWNTELWLLLGMEVKGTGSVILSQHSGFLCICTGPETHRKFHLHPT